MSQEIVAGKLQVRGLDISREIISQMELGKYSIRVSVLLAMAGHNMGSAADVLAEWTTSQSLDVVMFKVGFGVQKGL